MLPVRVLATLFLLLASIVCFDAKADMHPTRGEAYSHCVSMIVPQENFEYTCKLQPPANNAYWQWYYKISSGSQGWMGAGHNWSAECASPGDIWSETTHSCSANCGAKPDYTFSPSGNQYVPPMGTVGCHDGCVTAYFDNGDGTITGKPSVMSAACDSLVPNCEDLGLTASGYTFNAYALSCEPPAVECESNQVRVAGGICADACPAGMHTDATGACKPDGDNCPAGEIKAPSGACLPGEGQCAAGEAKKKDGTCGKDSDGDGVADDDDDDPDNDSDKESFSGGDSCDAPPSCSGSVIDCGMARIQWRIDCNTRKDITISGGACNAMPICTGRNCNAMEYSQLLMQWRTSCKEAAMGGGESGDNSDLIDYLETGGNPDGSGVGGMPGGEGVYQYPEDGEGVEPDDSGYGYGRSCPTIPPVSVFGTTVAFNLQPLCDWVGLGGTLVMILTGLICVRMFASGSGA